MSDSSLASTNSKVDQSIQAVDPSVFGRVAVLCGGHSAERHVSLNSGASVQAALCQADVDATIFDPAETHIEDIKKYDRVFNVMHGRGGEDGQIQGVLEFYGVPYTGSGIMASALGMDKISTKQLWKGYGLPTAPFVALTEDTDWAEVVATLGLPLIVKPIHEGSSIGMSKVLTVEELPEAYAKAASHKDKVMAEQWITGREFTITIIDDQAYPVIRLNPALEDTHSFFDYHAKYQRGDTQYHIPCGLDEAEEQQLQQLSVQAFLAVGASGWGRVDAMQDQDGQFYLLEINTVPGMTDKSLVPMAAAARGIEFRQLCLHLLTQTL